jgi:hypothetical protein
MLMGLLMRYASLAYAAPPSRPFKATLQMTAIGQAGARIVGKSPLRCAGGATTTSSRSPGVGTVIT